MKRFFKELRRRNVLKETIAYLVVAWLILQVGAVVLPIWGAPDWTLKTLTITLAIGLPLWIVFSWYYQFTSSGIQKAEKAAPDPEMSEKEKPLVRGILVAFAIVLLFGFAWIAQKYLDADEEKTIILLPPKNYTGQENLDYLVAGVNDLLYTDLCKVGEKLRVISPFTSRALAEAGKSISEIAAEMDADYFVETSVSCVEGDNMCINTSLVEFDSEERQVWTEEYYEKKGEILNFNHFLVNKIADDINVQISPEVERAFTKSSSVDTTAIDLYIRAEHYLDQISARSLPKAAEYYRKAIEKDPEWASPYAGLARVISSQMQMGFISPSTGIPKLNEYLNIAFELDPNSPQAYMAKAISAVWAEWNWEKGETAFLESLRRDPNNPKCRMFYAHLLTILRRNDEAVKQAQIAESLDPMRPMILGLHSVVLNWGVGDYKAAVEKAEEALAIDRDHPFAQNAAYLAYVSIGDYESAYEYWRKWNSPTWKKYGVDTLFERTFREQGWVAVMKEAIRVNEEVWAKDGLLRAYSQAGKYFIINDYDKALEYYEQSWDAHNPNVPYLSTKIYYSKMKDLPGYIELLKKMNLPTD